MIGRSIGNYKIVRVLGEGGMGTVYLAEHPMIGKRVAVKMLRPDLGTDPGLVSRFFQEAKAVNEIRHPNIVDVYDFGHTGDGIVYFVMELLEGKSMRDQLSASGPMAIEQAVTTARQVIDALAAAHRVGIIHRDLKPDNVFLVADSQVPGGTRAKLFDFGVAKLVGEKQAQVGHKTIDGAVVGTPFYMSPEQALCHEVGASADIYAMGVVMFEMLTGQVPFRSEQLVLLLNAILKQTAPPPSRLRPEVPGWLDRVVLHCLEKDPEARPRSMEEVSVALAAGMAERSGQFAALGATVFAASAGGVTPTPVAVPPAQAGAVARASATQAAQPGSARAAAQEGSAASSAHHPVVHGGVARPGQPPGPIARLREYLDTTRVRRVAVPLIVVSALVIVASIFASSASRPAASPIPAQPAPPPAAPAQATIHLISDPSGAEVTRLPDNHLLGTTPVDDACLADGHQVSYRFHLAGYEDVNKSYEPRHAGELDLMATLKPLEHRRDSAAHAGVSSKHLRRDKKDDKREVAQQAAAPPAKATQAAQPTEAMQPATLPPLGERNPVRRLHR